MKAKRIFAIAAAAFMLLAVLAVVSAPSVRAQDAIQITMPEYNGKPWIIGTNEPISWGMTSIEHATNVNIILLKGGTTEIASFSQQPTSGSINFFLDKSIYPVAVGDSIVVRADAYHYVSGSLEVLDASAEVTPIITGDESSLQDFVTTITTSCSGLTAQTQAAAQNPADANLGQIQSDIGTKLISPVQDAQAHGLLTKDQAQSLIGSAQAAQASVTKAQQNLGAKNTKLAQNNLNTAINQLNQYNLKASQIPTT